MHAAIAEHQEALERLCRQYRVHRLELFGSAAVGLDRPGESDFDFLVEFEPLPPGGHADAYFEVDRYAEFCAGPLAHADEAMQELVSSGWFDDLLVATVRSTFPAHEHERFVAHYRGLLGAWVRDAAGAG